MPEQNCHWEKSNAKQGKIIILIWQSSFCVLAKIEAINERIQISNINIAQAKYLIGLSQRIKKRYAILEAKDKTFLPYKWYTT